MSPLGISATIWPIISARKIDDEDVDYLVE
jgi:hypothetical protein